MISWCSTLTREELGVAHRQVDIFLFAATESTSVERR